MVQALKGHCSRVVLQLHGSDPKTLAFARNRPFKLATRLLTGSVDALLVLSTEEQRQWQAFDSRVPAFVVKNPYARRARRLGGAVTTPGSERPRALFVGRLVEAKGIFDLVDAFARVVAEVPAELVVIGGGVEERRLGERVARLGLQDSVTIRGYLSPPDVATEYERATFFVFPSYWKVRVSDGALAEAMDAGLPVVTTRIGGAADHLVSGEHALFVEPRDPAGLAAAMLTLLRDAELRERMGRANRQRVRVFDPQIVADEHLALLRSLLEGRVDRVGVA